MFQRASKIIITESSSSKRAHPAIGDIGYLNNMYLFFVDRFILLDAFFFSYLSDRKERRDRCERKRFIIDLGMNKRLKRKLKNYGLPKKFFTGNRHVANLTLSGHNLVGGHLVESPDIDSLWYKNTNKKGQSRLRSVVKIPYGQIALAPHRKSPIDSDGPGALRCWIECMLPVFSTEMMFVPAGARYTPVATMANDIYRDVLDFYTTIRPTPNNRNAIMLRKDTTKRFAISKSPKKTIEGAQRVYALSRVLLYNCDMNILMDGSRGLHRNIFSKNWNRYGIEHAYDHKMSSSASGNRRIYNGVPEMIIKFVTSFFFRAIIMPGDTESSLLDMQEFNALQWKPSKIKERSKEFEDIKRAAEFGSAALNRIFERDLLR